MCVLFEAVNTDIGGTYGFLCCLEKGHRYVGLNVIIPMRRITRNRGNIWCNIRNNMLTASIE